jgi:uncharacterized protein (TIGR02246 family)
MRRAAPLFSCALLLGGCAAKVDTKIDRARVDDGLQYYSQRLLAGDSTAIAAIFTPDGEIVNPSQPPVHGRAAIKAFLDSFSDFHVLANTDVATSTLIDGTTAEQIGTYHQTVRSPQGHAFDVSGRLEIEWEKETDGRWLIQQLASFPTPKA